MTASLQIASVLAPWPNLQVMMLGGRVRGNTLGVVDIEAVDMLRRLNVDLAIVGANGVSVERGRTTPDPAVAAVKEAAVRSRQKSKSSWFLAWSVLEAGKPSRARRCEFLAVHGSLVLVVQ